MNEIFDKETENEIKKNIVEFISKYEVNHMVFRCTQFDIKNVTYASIEKKIETKKNYKLDPDQVFLINGFIVEDGIQSANFFDNEILADYWNSSKKTFFKEIEALAGKGENKYALNSFFMSLFGMIDEAINRCNYQSWVNLKDPANNKERMQLGIKNRFMQLSLVQFNLDKVLQLIYVGFTVRYNILNDFKFELIKIYSRHLILRTINTLPQTPFTGKNKTDIYEVLVMMENHFDIKDFEKFKSVLLEMLALDVKKYKDFKSDIQQRKVKYLFLKKVLISSRSISKND